MHSGKENNLVIVIIIAVLVVVLFLVSKNWDIYFSQRVFAGLINGKLSVQKMIDWANFRAVGVDVGNTYSGLPNEKEREDYRQAFIDRFSFSFRKVGGNFRAFRNWRIYDNQDGLVTVAADYVTRDNKAILFTLARNGKSKLTAVQWE